jgi:hypothetical protein
MWESFKDIFTWKWYEPHYNFSLGLNYNTGFIVGEDGQPNGDRVTMLELGLLVGGLTIFLEYIPAETEE